jgi:hypothetical protein
MLKLPEHIRLSPWLDCLQRTAALSASKPLPIVALR